MANLDKTDFWRNGKLSGAVNLMYTDLLNVDVVKPSYSWSNRNSSFFLKTRLGYINEYKLTYFLRNSLSSHSINWEVTDIETIWDEACSEETGTMYFLVHNIDDDYRTIVSANISDGCVQNSFSVIASNGLNNTCNCGDWKFFKTTHPRGEKKTITSGTYSIIDGIQVNILEGGVYRGYFTTEGILDGSDSWGNIGVGDYIVVNDSANDEGSGFSGQVRTVTGFSDDMLYLIVDTPWNGFAIADENGNTYKRVEGNWLSASAYSEEGTVVGLSTGSLIAIFTKGTNYITYQPTLGCIISITESNGRIFALYDNGFVRYSKVGGRDQMFFDDEMYAGTGKSSLYAYRDFVIAFGKRSISVGVPTEYNGTTYYTMYQQSGTMGLKSRYSYGEHDGNLIFVSNDNRLMALGVAATSGKYMLSFEDIGQDVIWSKLSTMLDTDEAYIVDYNNELRVLVNTRANPIKSDSKNSETHIYKFDNQFKIWTEDHLHNILMYGYKYGTWYGDGGAYVRGLVESRDSNYYDITQTGEASSDYSTVYCMDFKESPKLLAVSGMKYPPHEVTAKVGAFLIENETTGMSGNPDLFNLAKLNKLIVTLGYGVYSNDRTKIKITSYREGIGVVTEVNNFESNDWVELITHAYLGKELTEELLEKKQCLLTAINDSQSGYIEECTANDIKVTDLIADRLRCDEGSKQTNFQDHNICINSSIYELAPHKPLTINVGDNQSYSSQIKVEIISESGDILNFGGFLAELFIAPIGVKGADGENLIEMSSC